MEQGRVVLEGKRLISQLANWGIKPLELYLSEPGYELDVKKTFMLHRHEMERICSSENPPDAAGLYPLPQASKVNYKVALYLEDISDPGNMGTIFRVASAFGIDCLLLSPNCCEISSPKVIRASLGAVYKVPFAIGNLQELMLPNSELMALEMDGNMDLHEYDLPDHPIVFALGNEAHGLSEETLAKSHKMIRINISGGMESLNAAMCAGIVAYHVSCLRK